jgi:hypothetical protein
MSEATPTYYRMGKRRRVFNQEALTPKDVRDAFTANKPIYDALGKLSQITLDDVLTFTFETRFIVKLKLTSDKSIIYLSYPKPDNSDYYTRVRTFETKIAPKRALLTEFLFQNIIGITVLVDERAESVIYIRKENTTYYATTSTLQDIAYIRSLPEGMNLVEAHNYRELIKRYGFTSITTELYIKHYARRRKLATKEDIEADSVEVPCKKF